MIELNTFNRGKISLEKNHEGTLWIGKIEFWDELIELQFSDQLIQNNTIQEIQEFIMFLSKSVNNEKSLRVDSMVVLSSLASVFWKKKEERFLFEITGIHFIGKGASLSSGLLEFELIFDLVNGVEDYYANWIVQFSGKLITGVRREQV